MKGGAVNLVQVQVNAPTSASGAPATRRGRPTPGCPRAPTASPSCPARRSRRPTTSPGPPTRRASTTAATTTRRGRGWRTPWASSRVLGRRLRRRHGGRQRRRHPLLAHRRRARRARRRLPGDPRHRPRRARAQRRRGAARAHARRGRPRGAAGRDSRVARVAVQPGARRARPALADRRGAGRGRHRGRRQHARRPAAPAPARARRRLLGDERFEVSRRSQRPDPGRRRGRRRRARGGPAQLADRHRSIRARSRPGSRTDRWPPGGCGWSARRPTRGRWPTPWARATT